MNLKLGVWFPGIVLSAARGESCNITEGLRGTGSYVKNGILAAALLFTAAPMFAQTAKSHNPPQTFALSKDGACSITSSPVSAQFRVPKGLTKGFTHYDIIWGARRVTTGCRRPCSSR